MKPLHKGNGLRERQPAKNAARGKGNRTSKFGKHIFERTAGADASALENPDLKAALVFAEGVLATAEALFKHLQNARTSDPALPEIGALLKRARLSFGEFERRTQGCPTAGGL